MSPELIKEINVLCPSDQGIFVEPNGIPTHIKEPVIYTRWIKSGFSGGGYGGEHTAQPFTSEPPENRFKILDIILEKLKPNISYLQYKKIMELWDENNYSVNQYYGNFDDYVIKFMPLSVLEQYLETI